MSIAIIMASGRSVDRAAAVRRAKREGYQVRAAFLSASNEFSETVSVCKY